MRLETIAWMRMMLTQTVRMNMTAPMNSFIDYHLPLQSLFCVASLTLKVA
jgi:hypothetical protein